MTDAAQPHPHLTVTRDGAVLTVSLANPDRRNAQTPSLWAALAEVATGLDPAVRVVVLRGEGPSFSAGLDRGMLAPGGIPGEVDMIAMAAGSAEAAAEVIEDFQRGFSAWAAVPAVVVAAVQGHAIGAGFQLALAADLRVVADDVQFAMRETSLGLVPDLAGTTPLVSLVGVARALEICATGRFVGAAEAVAMGLANVAVPGGRPRRHDGRPRGGPARCPGGGPARAEATAAQRRVGRPRDPAAPRTRGPGAVAARSGGSAGALSRSPKVPSGASTSFRAPRNVGARPHDGNAPSGHRRSTAMTRGDVT